MNTLKKSLLSPEPLMYSRRSSLPVSLDNVIENSPLIELVKKFNFSQRNLEAVENDGNCLLPEIVLPSPSATSLSPCNSEISSPFITHDKEIDKIKDDAIRYMTRRASCEANFFPASPAADVWVKTSPWSKRTLSYCKSYSPVQRNAEELSKRKTDVSPGRIHQCVHFPSLSPCFEGKSKQNCFPFFQIEKDRNCEEKISGEIIEDNNIIKGLHGSRRRETIHNYLSPTFRVYENILTPKTKQRRNSFGTTSVNISPTTHNRKTALDLQRGNPNLKTKRNVDSTILGKGGFGVVKAGYWHGEKVAIKILKGKKALTSLENEESSLAFGFHMNLVKTKAIVLSKDSLKAEIKYSFQKDDVIELNNEVHSYVVPIKNFPVVIGMVDQFSPTGLPLHWSLVISELCTSDNLLSLINNNSPIGDKDLLRFLYQISSALKYMHEIGYAHLDVKPSNCFLTLSGIIKLGDFGCICKLKNIPSKSLGTIAYQAPEVLGGKPVTDRCDIYSLGITAWQMLTQEIPYDSEHPHVIIYKVTRMNHRPTLKKQIGASFIEEALFSIAERCWSVLPGERPSVDALTSIVTSLYFASSVSPLPKCTLE